jgi:imidazolonepropionase-like amidohydrolase
MTALLLRGATLLTGTGPSLADHAVLVEDGRIAWVGPSVDAAEGPAVVDIDGLTLLPGLIDAHVHLCADGGPDFAGQIASGSIPTAAIRCVVSLAAALQSGITTVRDCGSPSGVALDVARAVDSGLIEGPRVLAAGRVLTMTGGHGHFLGTEVDGPDEVRRAVRTEIKRGAALIKVMATGGVLTPGVDPGQTALQPDELTTAVRTAHDSGRRVACHAISAQGICNALRAGVDTIEHGNFIDEEGIELSLEHGAFLIPTLLAPRGALRDPDPEVVRKAERLVAVHRRNFARAFQAGVRVAAGTDAGTPFNPHGGLVEELKLMVEYCMDPLQAILAATRHAAEALGVEDLVGTLEPGKVADLIVVGGAPLEDVAALADIRLVMKDGRVVVDRLEAATRSFSL